MTKPEEKPSADAVASLQRAIGSLRTLEGTGAFLTVTTLLGGFAFAGLILYLGTDHPHATHIVAASLLAAAFIVLLYAAISTAYLVEISGSERKPLTRAIYQYENTLSLMLGLTLLLGSVCVMSFAWSSPLGWVVVPLSGLFVVRFVWVEMRDVRLGHKDRVIYALLMLTETAESALGSDLGSFSTDVSARTARARELLAKCAEAGGSPDAETLSELRAVTADLMEKVETATRAMPKLRELQEELREAAKGIGGEE